MVEHSVTGNNYCLGDYFIMLVVRWLLTIMFTRCSNWPKNGASDLILHMFVNDLKGTCYNNFKCPC